MKIIHTLILFFIPFSQALAQPGGGGVTIKHIFDTSGNEINVENSETVSLSCYLLIDTLFLSTHVYSKLENHFENFNEDSTAYVPQPKDSSRLILRHSNPRYKHNAIRLKPINSIDPTYNLAYDNFRIMLSTPKDTMVVDFIKVLGENAHGITSVIDTLTFKPGYYQFKKRKVYPVSYPEDTFWDKDSLDNFTYSSLITDEERLITYFSIMNTQTITDFYTAFQQHDAEKMASFYHPDVVFNDPVFINLNQTEVQSMWKMLIERSKGNLQIEFHSVQGDDNTASCIWEAKYPFSKSGRQVHNIIHSSMEFKDGLIIKHTDSFNFWRWSRMALGTSGVLLGWTPLVRKKVQTTARQSLDDYMSK